MKTIYSLDREDAGDIAALISSSRKAWHRVAVQLSLLWSSRHHRPAYILDDSLLGFGIFFRIFLPRGSSKHLCIPAMYESSWNSTNPKVQDSCSLGRDGRDSRKARPDT